MPAAVTLGSHAGTCPSKCMLLQPHAVRCNVSTHHHARLLRHTLHEYACIPYVNTLYNLSTQRGHMVCCPAGFVSARLRGDYSVTRDDRIDLEFRNITLNVGPFKAAEKVGGMQHHVHSCARSV
jgi:hypothetical protein